jgi:microcompartment protein CcmK/EutM
MIFARVAGTVVSTKKNDSITGTKYLLTRTCDQKGKLKNDYIVALDLVGAGTGEVVIIAQGSSSRQTELTYQKPIDAVIAGIVDLVEEKANIVFRKQTDAHL